MTVIEKSARTGLRPPLTGWSLEAFVTFPEQDPEVEIILYDTEGVSHRIHSGKWKLRDGGEWYTGSDMSDPAKRLTDGVVSRAMSLRAGSPKAPAGFFSEDGTAPPKKAVTASVAESVPLFLSEVRKMMVGAALDRFMRRWHGDLSEDQVVLSLRNAIVRSTMTA
jgi:hypothetical protein